MAKSKGGSEGTGGLFRRELPKMPEGYYSGGNPNPNLRAFVEAHLRDRPYDPVIDHYEVPPLTEPRVTTKTAAIYNMHTYPSKKPADAIREYIRHYTAPGDLCLDPFCGCGSTALAAMLEDRKAIAIDRSPAATFITANYCTPVDTREIKAAFQTLIAEVRREMDWLYETRCDRCGGKATTAYTIYSNRFQCPRCLEKVPLFDCVATETVDKKGKQKKIAACPHCLSRGFPEAISSRGEKFGVVPVLVSYVCHCGCTPEQDQRRHNDASPVKREFFERYDLGKLAEIAERDIPHWYPDAELSEVIPYRMLYKKDFRPSDAERLVDLFTKRNLWALSALMNGAAAGTTACRNQLRFAITGLLFGVSRMCQCQAGYIDSDSQTMLVITGTYYLPQSFKELNVSLMYEKQITKLTKGWDLIREDVGGQCLISTQSATELGDIPNQSVDYIFTDPPYGGNVQYGELNYLSEAWLGMTDNRHAPEIVINPARGIDEEQWAAGMRQAIRECYRVLKPGRWLSLCYHDTSEGTWELIQDIMAEAGFVPDTSDHATSIGAGQRSFNKITADKVMKRDLVINFRKPRLGEVSPQSVLFGNEDETTFRDKLHAIARDFLSANPGSTKDRVYDDVVSRMVRSGQMEAHNFDELLSQIAEPVAGIGIGERWYLREDEETKVDTAETEREDAAATAIRAFIRELLTAHPGEEGVHYSDLFEYFLYGVADKPRRQLAEWLPDYFYKTELGTWRLPSSPEEEKTKSDGRRSGVSRRVKRYLSYLRQGLSVPEKHRPTDSTLAEWLRHCKLAGLYQEGKLLFETGGLNLEALSDEAAVEAEEDYEVCVRMMERQPAAKPKRGKAKKAETTLELDL